MRALREDYPDLDPRRMALLADRLARIDLVSAWLEKQSGLMKPNADEVFGVVRDLEKWATRAEQVLKEAEADAAASIKPFDLALEMSAPVEAEAAEENDADEDHGG